MVPFDPGLILVELQQLLRTTEGDRAAGLKAGSQGTRCESPGAATEAGRIHVQRRLWTRR